MLKQGLKHLTAAPDCPVEPKGWYGGWLAGHRGKAHYLLSEWKYGLGGKYYEGVKTNFQILDVNKVN